jgi:hypothetical protein
MHGGGQERAFERVQVCLAIEQRREREHVRRGRGDGGMGRGGFHGSAQQGLSATRTRDFKR